ncbi:MAG TPA: PRC-barrel domain-containing protein [Rhizomicrobium sp.]|nr:PRC-barrel domain-containing protein [Rhizomicrobium sp.]
MPTPSGHTRAILSSKVKGTTVYNTSGEKIGHVEDVVLDKMSNNIMFAVIGFGGILSMGEKYHPVPWSVLDYNPDKDGYVVPVSQAELERAPTSRLEDVTKNEGDLRTRTYDFYKAPHYWE